MAENPKKKIDDATLKVWIEFKQTNAKELLNYLVERYLSVVKYNAEQIYSKLPDDVELDDLTSAGTFALIDAIKAFDLERGVKFETYCAPRIRGAILVEPSVMVWVPRYSVKELEISLGRSPSDEYVKLKRDATAVGLVSLSRKWFETDSEKDV